MPDKPRILIVDDEPQIRRFLSAALEAEGYVAIQAETGAAGLQALATRPPDALILDLGLPDMDGATVLAQGRSFFAGPIIIVSARSDPAAKIDILDRGADDYVQKPFVIGELLARLRVAMRNKAEPRSHTGAIVAGQFQINPSTHVVSRRGDDVRLTTHEYNLLTELTRFEGRVLTHRQLLIAVWGSDDAQNMRHMRVVVQRLRQKLELDPSQPRHIRTEIGVGYSLHA